MKENHAVFIGIGILISLCYGNSLKGNFVFDDTEAIVRNADLEWNINNDLFSWNLFRHDFWGNKITDDTSHKSYRPLTIILFRLIKALSNILQDSDDLNPVFFHCANLIFYYLSCCLLYRALRSLFSSPILELSKRMSKQISILSTMLFVAHPVHCEPVVSCVGLADIMSGMLSILSLIYYVEKTCFILEQDSKLITNCLCLTKIIVSTGLAMLFKEQGITFLGIYICLDAILLVKYRNKNRLVRSSLVIGIGFHLIAAMLLIYVRLSIMNFKQPVFDKMDNPSVHIESIMFRCINYGYIYLLNGLLMICPVWLCFDWSMGCIRLIESFTDYRFALVLAFYFGTVLAILRVMTINRKILETLLILSLFLTIPFTPSSNLFFPVGFVIAERNLFMPVLGYLLIFVYFHQRCCQLSSNTIKSILNGCLWILLVTYSIRSHYRTIDWNNERNLFQKDVSVCPENAKIYYNIGKIAADSGDSKKALDYYEKSLSLYENYTSAMNNAANILKDQGQIEYAKSLLERAILLDPKFAPAWMNLAIVQMALKHYRQSEESFFKAIHLRPKHARTHFNLGNLYLERNQYSDAEIAYNKAVELDPKLIVAWNNLILLKQNHKQLESAKEIADTAIRFNPKQHCLHFLMGNILGQQNLLKQAESHFKKAIELNPTLASYYNNLAVLYHRNKMYSQAHNYYSKTLQLDPNHSGARKQLKLLQM